MTIPGPGLDFCGLWKQAGEDDTGFLMRVNEWRVGHTISGSDALWIRVEVITYIEGAMLPTAFKIVMPNKGYVFVWDARYVVSTSLGVVDALRAGDPKLIEFSGHIYGLSPLQEYPSEMVRGWVKKVDVDPLGGLNVSDGAKKLDDLQRQVDNGIMTTDEMRERVKDLFG